MTNLVFAPPDSGSVLLLTGLPGGSDKIYDRSPYGRAGTITGATWMRLPGGLWVLNFDGVDDYVDLGTANILPTGTNPFTIMFWAKHNTIPASDYQMFIRLKQDGEFFIAQNNGVGGINHALGFSFRGSSSIIGATAANTYANAWTHYAVVYLGGDKSTVSNYLAYINRNPEALIQGGVAGGSLNANIIGNDGAAGIYGGKQVLHKINNRALTALEIQNIYNREKHLFGAW